MFGRASTYLLGSSSNIEFVLGKKWQSEYTTYGDDDDRVNTQFLSNWINEDGSYPPVNIPENIPDFVSSRRVIIGDESTFWGPLSYEEALFVTRVSKTIKLTDPPICSVTAGPTQAETNWIELENRRDTSFKQYPYNLIPFFGSILNSNYFNGFDADNTITDRYSRIDARVDAPAQWGGAGLAPVIAIDIDNPNDLWVGLLAASTDLYYYRPALVHSYAMRFRGKNIDYSDPDPNFNSSTTKDISVNIGNYFPYFFVDIALSEEQTTRIIISKDNPSYSHVYNYEYDEEEFVYTQTASLIESNINFKIGQLSLSKKAYGIKVEKTTQLNNPVPVHINIGNLDINVEITEFWPYENADSQPVYSTSTGATINSPVP